MRTTSWIAAALLAGCGGTASTPPELPSWDPTLPEANVMGVRRGSDPGARHHPPALALLARRLRRQPRAPAAFPTRRAWRDLRAALCTDRIDFADLTDHDDTMADEEFTTLFSMRGTDSR